MECSILNYEPHILYLIASFAAIGLLDGFLWTVGKNNSRWYKLHVFANLVSCIFSYNDFLELFFNPLHDSTNSLSSSLIPPNITLALHLYHMLIFSNISIIDWVHHIVMLAVLFLAYACPNLSLTNYALFVVNGFPGGIDYFLLILVKDGAIERLTEKRINSKLNIWVRGPGILVGAYIVYLQWRYKIIHYSIYVLMLVMAGLYWNAQYFTERVVYNWGLSSSSLQPATIRMETD